MTLVLPDVGEVLVLKNFMNFTAPQNGVLRLYKSNTTPAESDTAATYTEAAFTGYAAITLLGASWSFTAGTPSVATYATQSFTSSVAQTAEPEYGYYVTEATSGILKWAERFSGTVPYNQQNNGDIITVTPSFEMS